MYYIYIYQNLLNYLLVQRTSRNKSSLDSTIEQINFKTYFSVSKFISASLNNFECFRECIITNPVCKQVSSSSNFTCPVENPVVGG